MTRIVVLLEVAARERRVHEGIDRARPGSTSRLQFFLRPRGRPGSVA